MGNFWRPFFKNAIWVESSEVAATVSYMTLLRSRRLKHDTWAKTSRTGPETSQDWFYKGFCGQMRWWWFSDQVDMPVAGSARDIINRFRSSSGGPTVWAAVISDALVGLVDGVKTARSPANFQWTPSSNSHIRSPRLSKKLWYRWRTKPLLTHQSIP